MTTILRQSTAATVRIGPFLSISDPSVKLTTATIAQGNVRLSKNGGDFAQIDTTGNLTHDEFGYYILPLTSDDTDERGMLAIAVNITSAFPVYHEFQIVAVQRYDSMVDDLDDPSYADGAVWYDNNNGVANNSGTARKPISTAAALSTKMTNTGLRRARIISDATLTLAAAQSRRVFIGDGTKSVVVFGGFDISDCVFRNCAVSGDTLAAAGTAEFIDCEIGTGTYQDLRASRCQLSATATLNGDATLHDCTDVGDYDTAPSLDFDLPASTRRCVASNYIGRIQAENMNANCGLILSGVGRITVDDTCTGGTIDLYGLWDVVDNADELVTINKYDDSSITTLLGYGDGPHTVTFTIKDSATDLPIQGVDVRAYANIGEDLNRTTDAAGQVTFYMRTLTYTITLKATGYTADNNSITKAITGNSSDTEYTMTSFALTASNPGKTTGYTTCLDELGDAEANVMLYLQISDVGAGSTGFAYDSTIRGSVSDSNGLVQFSNLIKGQYYRIWRANSEREATFQVPVSAGNSYEIPSFIGSP